MTVVAGTDGPAEGPNSNAARIAAVAAKSTRKLWIAASFDKTMTRAQAIRRLVERAKGEEIMLTKANIAELKVNGTQNVRLKLLNYPGTGMGASIGGFKSGEMTKSDIEDWLIEQVPLEEKREVQTLFWSRVAAWAGIAAVIVGLLAIFLQK